jgi:hypothetical protein
MVYTDAKGGGRDKYYGEVAQGYDAKRTDHPKWTIEQNLIEDMLSDLPEGSMVFDCPVGTGRFVPFYESKGFQWAGLDKSREMLDLAKAKATKKGGYLFHGDILDADGMKANFEDKMFNAAVMCRLTRWLDGSVMGSAEIECRQAMANLERITKDRIIFTIRVDHPRQDIIRPIEWFGERAGLRAQLQDRGDAMRWLDVCGPPGAGKSTLCDPLSPHRFPIEERMPPIGWHDWLNEVTDLMRHVYIPPEEPDHNRFVAAVRMNIRSSKKMAMVARKDGDVYIQTGLVQRGLGFGWRLNYLGKDINILRHYFRLMPISIGVAVLVAPREVVEERNRERLKNPETAHENRDFMVELMEPGFRVLREEMSKRSVPLFEIDATDDIEASREQLVAISKHEPVVEGYDLDDDIVAPAWWA